MTDLDELRVIWTSQDDRPLYAINESTLQGVVRRESRAFGRRVLLRDVREVAIGLVAAAGLLVCGVTLGLGAEGSWQPWVGPVAVTRWHVLLLLVASGLWLFFAGYQLLARRRQRQRDRHFDDSLRGDVERTLSRTEQQIRMTERVLWWGVGPVWLATALVLYVMVRLVPTPPAAELLAAIVIPLGFVLDLLYKRRPLHTELIPLKRRFESLRRTLAESEQSPG